MTPEEIAKGIMRANMAPENKERNIAIVIREAEERVRRETIKEVISAIAAYPESDIAQLHTNQAVMLNTVTNLIGVVRSLTVQTKG